MATCLRIIMAILRSPKHLRHILVGLCLTPVLFTAKASAIDTPSLSKSVFSAQLTPSLRSPYLLAQQSNFASFFEDGRLLSENQLRKQPPDPALPIDRDAKFWQPIIFKAGGCSFWMPPGTLTEEAVVLPTQVGEVSFRTVAANSENSRYLVAYAAKLSNKQLKNPQALLDAIVARVISAQNFTPMENRSITLDGSKGRELSFQNATDVIVFRAYLNQNRAYVIGSRAPKSKGVPSRETTAFLSSFQFLNP